MNRTFHIPHAGDLFEIKLRGHVIARITCYYGGQQRQDVQFDDAPEEVQERILDYITEIMNSED